MRLKGNFFVFVRRTIQYAGARQLNLRTRSLMPQEAATLRLFQYPRAKGHQQRSCAYRECSFAGFGKVQHGLISTGEGGLCYTVIFLFVRRVEADGNGIKQPCQFWYDVAAVF